LTKSLEGLRKVSVNSFGFEAINRAIVGVTQTSAEGLRVTQTGVLSWNVVGILLTVIVLFVIFALGA
jgi:uncharacterized protein with PQ loop repeat